MRTPVCELLEIEQTTVNWPATPRRDWTTYLADRASTPHQGT
jgi:hypothetical protein